MYVSRIGPCYLLWVVLLTASVDALAAKRTKTDVLVMKNGDRITCEIKSLSRGQLEIKTAYTLGTVTVNWDLVERIESTQLFRVEDSFGKLTTGTIKLKPDQSAAGDKLQISEASKTAEVEHSKVVSIDQLDRGFLQTIKGSIDAGLSHTSNNSTRQLTVNASARRTLERNDFQLTWSSFLNQVTEGENTNKYSAQAAYRRHLRRRQWYFGGLLGVLRSDQQNLKIRLTPGGMFGRTLVRTNRTEAGVFGGLVANSERYLEPVDGVTKDLSAEGIFGTNVSFFRFDSTQIDANLAFFPSITQAGRYRIDFDTSLYLDLWGDLYLRFTFSDSLDSRPQGSTPNNDVSVTTSVGWSF